MTPDTVSEKVYREELLPWLPPKIIDCHTHAGLAKHMGPVADDRYEAIWALEVATEQSWEVLRSNYRTLFPEQEVRSLVFGWVYKETYIEQNNDYVLQGILDPSNNAAGLLVTRPEFDPEIIAKAMDRGFLGIKPYPDLAQRGGSEVSIYEFLPREHLRLLNERCGILMLHLPRANRIGDPENIRELLEISENYPEVKIITAHIGRAFCLPTAQRGLPHFVNTPNVFFDTSANLNADVFTYALETIGPDRILFGTDLPITMMRGVREHVGERYINYTDGNYSWNTNRKSPEEEARYTYFAYEELKALITAVQRAGLGKQDLEKIMYTNAHYNLFTS